MSSLKNLPELKLHSHTTIWNWHRCGGLVAAGYNKTSNLYKKLQEIKASGYRGMVTFNVSCIGRSGHSASKVEVYLGTVNVSKHGSTFYSERNAEFLID